MNSLWEGKFGAEWTQRNRGSVRYAREFFTRCLKHADGVQSAVELGANVGHNLRAIKDVFPAVTDVAGVEINDASYRRLHSVVTNAYHEDLCKWEPPRQWSLSFTKGALIHIPPDQLDAAFYGLYNATYRYILMAEYFSPIPREVIYRGNANALWARDFCSDLMAHYPTLHMLDYGFVYSGDPTCPQDNITWWLLERTE